MKNQKPKQVESSYPSHFPISSIFPSLKAHFKSLNSYRLLNVSNPLFNYLTLFLSYIFFSQAIFMKNNKSPLFTFSSFGWLHTLFFPFFFSLLEAYKEGCFGKVFNLVPKEISRHSFVLFVLLSGKKNLIILQKLLTFNLS